MITSYRRMQNALTPNIGIEPTFNLLDHEILRRVVGTFYRLSPLAQRVPYGNVLKIEYARDIIAKRGAAAALPIMAVTEEESANVVLPWIGSPKIF